MCTSLIYSCVVTNPERPSNLKLASAEAASPEFNFVAAGDFGCGESARNTFNMMTKMEPELYLTLGDYSYQPELDCWYDIVKSAGSALKVVVGNHDTEGSVLKTMMNKFNLRQQYYSFDHQNGHFLALSSELGSGEDKGQFEFAKSDLAKSSSNPNTDWIVVYFHRPFYSGSGVDNVDMRDLYHPLFQKYNVDLVLSGHAHNYQRSFPLDYNENRPARPLIMDKGLNEYINKSGTVFTIVGTGGEDIQGADKKPYLASIYEGYGCLNIQINGRTLNAEFYTDQGKTIDSFTIVKDKNDREVFNPMDNLQQVSYDNPLD
jgi:hypothetical protein